MPARRCAGTAVTVLLHPGDNWMMHVAAEQIQPGDIVVAAVHRRLHRRLFRRPAGDLVPGARRDGPWSSTPACRDVKDLTEMGFPVWSKAISAKGTIKSTHRLGQHPGGLRRRAGESRRRGRRRRRRRRRACPARRRRKAAEAAAAREANEGEKRAKLPSGVLGLDMYKMREPLEKAGLKYID